MFNKKKIKNLLKYFRKNKIEILLILTLNILLLIVNYLSLCSGYLKFADFDFQTFLTWNYSAFNNLVPYKDLYYPYGLMPFYKDGNIYFLILYFITSLVTLNTFILIFKKVFKKNKALYLLVISFLVFVYLISNITTFNRYGISIVIAITLSYLFYSNANSKKFYFLSGLILSTVFWLVHDQGILGFTILFFFLGGQIMNNIRSNEKKLFLISLTKNMSHFLAGSFLGLLPFIIYLVKNNALNSFWYYLTVSLPEFPLMSKTPFFNLFLSLNNIFSIGILSFSILFVTYKIFQNGKKSVFTYLEIGLIITIILFELKNVVRLMENVVAFACFVLFAIISWQIITRSKKSLENSSLIKLVYFLVLLFTILIFYLTYGDRSGIKNKTLLSIKAFNCYETNLNKISQFEEQKLVIQKLKQFKNFNNKILSYPGDPIFYVLLKQKQPYFTSIYEASSKTSQNMNINYLKDNINYVVINTRNKAIQDEVPNYIRGVYELKYIFGNYSVKDSAGDFLILERHQNSDFFLNSNYELTNEYKKHLLDINLESIPLSEGRNKKRYILNTDNKFLTKDFNQKKINKYLENNNLSSDKIILLVNSRNVTDDYFSIKIITKNNLTTNIKMKSCKESYCVINLSNVPLFYNSRQIKNFEFDDKILVSILRVSDGNIERLW